MALGDCSGGGGRPGDDANQPLHLRLRGLPYSPQSWNAYAYVGNQPLRFTDPLGLFSPEQAYDSTMPLWSGFGMGGGEGDCTVNGADVGCGFASGILASGNGKICANNDCGTGVPDPFTIPAPAGSNVCSGLMGAPENCTETPFAALAAPLPSIGGMFGTGCSWLDPACAFFVGMDNAIQYGRPTGLLQAGGAVAVGVVVAAPGTVWEAGEAALGWVNDVVVPSAANSWNYLLTHPEVLVATADCAAELLPGSGPPPADPVGLACHGVRAGLGDLGVNW